MARGSQRRPGARRDTSPSSTWNDSAGIRFGVVAAEDGVNDEKKSLANGDLRGASASEQKRIDFVLMRSERTSEPGLQE